MIGWVGRMDGAGRRWPLVAAVLLLCALLVAWRQPWRVSGEPRRTAPGPAPSAMPAPGTPARLPDQIALPSTTPAAAPPLAPAGPSATTAPWGAAVPPEAGSLIYLGRLDGLPGIIAANADGSERRLLVHGVYIALAWSPDGRRFAALGGTGYEQIAIFDATGRPLARYPARAGTQCDLRWSPDARFVVCSPTYPFLGRERTTILIADESGMREARVPPVVRTAFLGWPDPGVLGLVALPEEWPYAAAEVWLISLDDGEGRRLIQGDFLPLGWSADSRALLVLGGRQPRGGAFQPGEPVFTELIAVDVGTGERRILEQAFRLARSTIGGDPATRHWFFAGTLDPSGRQLALWIAREEPRGAPASPDLSHELVLIILTLREGGDLGMTRLARLDGGTGVSHGWSPDGRALALPRYSQPHGEIALEIVEGSAAPGVYPVSDRAGAGITWAPDGRWFAYHAPQGLAIARVGSPAIAILDPDGRAPAWRPTVQAGWER